MEKLICFVEPPKFYGGERWYNHGTVLSASGTAVEFEVSQQGRQLDDFVDLGRSPENYTGILVWEGEVENLWAMNHGADWEPYLIGKWRLPTDEELRSLVGELKAQTTEV